MKKQKHRIRLGDIRRDSTNSCYAYAALISVGGRLRVGPVTAQSVRLTMRRDPMVAVWAARTKMSLLVYQAETIRRAVLKSLGPESRKDEQTMSVARDIIQYMRTNP